MLATGEFRGTAIDCRARSSATARDRTGSQRRRSRRMRRGATVWAAAGAAGTVQGRRRGGGAAGRVAGLRGAAVRAAVELAAAAELAAAVGRYNEAKPICGRGFDPMMNAATVGP